MGQTPSTRPYSTSSTVQYSVKCIDRIFVWKTPHGPGTLIRTLIWDGINFNSTNGKVDCGTKVCVLFCNPSLWVVSTKTERLGVFDTVLFTNIKNSDSTPH